MTRLSAPLPAKPASAFRSARLALATTCLGLFLAFPSSAFEPRVKWVYEAESNLYAPPLVADVRPEPGMETVLSDSEARKMRCVDAQGRLLWEFDGGWKKRLTSAASLSVRTRPGKGALAIGNGDGALCCVDAGSGGLLWRREVGQLVWGAAIWADLDGDGVHEVVAGTQNRGVVALTAGGDSLWTYPGAGTDPISIACPIGACDVDGDGASEVFVVEQWGPLCLNGDGTLRWKAQTGDRFVSSPVVADADGDGAPELYCAARDDNALFRFDALSGELVWRAATVGGTDTYPGSAIAVGDVDQDGRGEIIMSEELGYVYCLGADGVLHWSFATEKRTHAAPSLGDVDGDGDIEVLVASGDHFLYCLDSWGQLEWRFATDLRLLSPATIADVDADGKTDILLCGSDRLLRCLTLDGRYDPLGIPWPSRRFDTVQSGSSFGKRRAPRHETVEEPLFPYGGFDRAKTIGKAEDYAGSPGVFETRKERPRGWRTESTGGSTWKLDPDTKASGAFSLKVVPVDEVTVLSSDPIEITRGLQSVRASILCHKAHPGRAVLRWTGRQGLLRRDVLKPQDAPDHTSAWLFCTTGVVTPPKDARWLTLVCGNDDGPAWWDDAELVGTFRRRPVLRALVNQVGYDIGAPKRFTARANFASTEASFELVDASGAPVYEAALAPAGRITGAYGNDWGYHYWRGDFSEFNIPGRYRIRITIGEETDVSWPFEIARGLCWSRTAVPAYRFFYYQRCGTAVEGYHGACHLDDAIGRDGATQYSLAGGWHDAGDYNKYHNAPYVFGLVRAYHALKPVFDGHDADGNGLSDLLDEILWGGDFSRRMISPDGSAYGGITSGYGFWGPPELETDNVPGTGDERPFDHEPDAGRDPSRQLAAMARIALLAPDSGPFAEAAQRAFAWRQGRGSRDLYQLLAALDLYEHTGVAAYVDEAKAIRVELTPSHLDAHSPHGPDFGYCVDAMERCDQVFGEDHSSEIREILVAKAEAMLELADNPYGVLTQGPKERPNFFGTPPDTAGWHVGTSSFLMNAAASMAIACRYDPDPRYLRFVYDQFNWTLGNNPYDICLMEGAGSAHSPTYHHRYTFSGVPRGAVPGSVVNGITWRDVADDRPHFDMRGLDIPDYESNEVWLPHNTAYLNALVNLRRAREQGGG